MHKNVPAVPANAEPQTRNFLAFVRESLLRLRGSGTDRAVTLKDLVELGLIDQKKADRLVRDTQS